jgi:hypothetical protein
MPIPNLIHPIPIVFRQINESTTIYDEHHREPVQQSKWGSNITVMGQIKWAEEKALTIAVNGKILNADGYVLFRYIDLQAKTVTLKGNENITSIGGVNQDLYVLKLRPVASYNDVGGSTMVKAFFEDRQPKRQKY